MFCATVLGFTVKTVLRLNHHLACSALTCSKWHVTWGCAGLGNKPLKSHVLRFKPPISATFRLNRFTYHFNHKNDFPKEKKVVEMSLMSVSALQSVSTLTYTFCIKESYTNQYPSYEYTLLSWDRKMQPFHIHIYILKLMQHVCNALCSHSSQLKYHWNCIATH